MESVKKKRGENWSTEEKEILRKLIAQSAKILEDKSTKTNINILKLKEWKNVANKLNKITGKSRSIMEIKLAWKRMKLAAKANLLHHRKEQFHIGNGIKHLSPSLEELQIMDMASHDFVIKNPNDISSKLDDIPSSNSLVEPIVIIKEESVQSHVNENPVIPYTEEIKCVQSKEETTGIFRGTTGLNVVHNRIEDGCQPIMNSDVDLKKRQIEMLEVEHQYKIKISQLKIKKLQLEIELLENQKKSNTIIQNKSNTEE